MARPLLDSAETAEYLNCTERYVRKLVAEKRIPVVRLGRLVRFAAADLDAFIAEHRVSPGDAA